MGYIGTFIAVCSLILSLYAVRLGRTNRAYDLLFKFYSELRLQESETAKTIDDIIPPEPDELDDQERYVRNYNSFFKQESTEAKFNLLCFAVIKRQIALEDFFALFAGYLQGRMEFWPNHNSHRIGNYPYTARVIDACIQKGLLPIKNNKKYLKERCGQLQHWKEGRKALSEMEQRVEQLMKKRGNSGDTI